MCETFHFFGFFFVTSTINPKISAAASNVRVCTCEIGRENTRVILCVCVFMYGIQKLKNSTFSWNFHFTRFIHLKFTWMFTQIFRVKNVQSTSFDSKNC